ncbi:MAG: MarR family transcriptional regulator [Anaerolineae bacterium]|nr:MarR family transcriptional regulator [Anaerolineae bacterium]
MNELTHTTAQHLLALLPRLSHRLRDAAQPHQITVGQFRCLALLSRGPTTLGELANRYGVSPPTMSRMVSGLVERGWVSRVEDPLDRRGVRLEALPTGRAICEEMFEDAREQLAQYLEGLTPEELAHLHHGLQAVARLTAQTEGGVYPLALHCRERQAATADLHEVEMN